MSSTSSSPIARAVAELETEKANLLARAAKVDEAIANLRALFHLPAERAVKATSTPTIPGDTTAAIRSALARGPLSPGDLADAIAVDRAVLRPVIRALEQEGVVVTTGVTANRRIALAPAAAKEAL